MGRIAVAVLALTGCDGLFGLVRINPTDAAIESPSDVSSTDAPPAGSWSVPVALTEINTGDGEADASFTADLLTLMFSSNRPGGEGDYDIYLATRATTLEPFGPPVHQANLSSFAGDFGSISADGLTAYVVSSGDVYFATRGDVGGVFGQLIRDDGLSTANQDFNPSVAANGLVAVIDYNGDMYISTRTSVTSTWPTPQFVSELASNQIDASGSFNSDATTIVFHSERVNPPMRDLYIATRVGAGPFMPPAPIPELNTVMNESDPHISADGHTIVFTRNGDLYVSTR